MVRGNKTKKRTIIIGSRGSKLALIQANSVRAELEKVHPEFIFELTTIVTKGDRSRGLAIRQIPGQGLFVKEIEEALLRGKIDLAMHSLKDMPTKLPPGLSLAAVTERIDPRDALVSNGAKLAELPTKATLGTSSLRRTAQLLAYRPDLKVQPVRGNIDTRLQKVSSGEVSGVVLAVAGMIRLGLTEVITEYLPLEQFLPAVGQAALAIEIRDGDSEMARLVAALNHEPTWRSVIAERNFLHTLGGGCSTPIAALGTATGNIIRLQGMVASQNGSKMLRNTEEGTNPEDVGSQLAGRMLKMGAAELIRESGVE